MGKRSPCDKRWQWLEQFTFTTGGIPLKDNTEYVAFLWAYDYFNDPTVEAVFGSLRRGREYDGGNVVYSSHSYHEAGPTCKWPMIWDDAALTMSFSPIPAPSAALLGMIGLGMVAWIRRRNVGPEKGLDRPARWHIPDKKACDGREPEANREIPV